MNRVAAFLLGLIAGLLARPRRTAQQLPGRGALVSETLDLPMADPPAPPAMSPLQAFNEAWQRANKAAWEAHAAIAEKLEQSDDPALKKSADKLLQEIKAMSAIAREHALVVLAKSGAIEQLGQTTNALETRAAELPRATNAVQAANAVVGAAASFVKLFS